MKFAKKMTTEPEPSSSSSSTSSSTVSSSASPSSSAFDVLAFKSGKRKFDSYQTARFRLHMMGDDSIGFDDLLDVLQGVVRVKFQGEDKMSNFMFIMNMNAKMDHARLQVEFEDNCFIRRKQMMSMIEVFIESFFQEIMDEDVPEEKNDWKLVDFDLDLVIVPACPTQNKI